jgi:5-methylcytosine-specific restriction enzyme A
MLMGRLTALPARLKPAGHRLMRALSIEPVSRSRMRDETVPWRRWYKTARWQRLRWSVLVRDLFTCRLCRRIEADTSQLVADHRVPHRGDEALFWDDGNLQCLCKACHDGVKQGEERAGRW